MTEMKRRIPSVNFILCISAVLLLQACDERLEDSKHPLFIKAKNSLESGKKEDAAKSFSEYLRVNPDSSAAHYELAILNEDMLDDQLAAIYHYKRYIELAPQSENKENTKLWLEEAERRYFEKARKKFSEEDKLRGELEKLVAEKAGLEAEMKKLSVENVELKSKLPQIAGENAQASQENPPPAADPAIAGEKVKPASTVPQSREQKKAQTRMYRVQQGDTLSKISQKFYGDSKHYKLIYEANKDRLKSPAELRLGEEIAIPPKPD